MDVGGCSAAGVACATGLHVASTILPRCCPNWKPLIRHEEMWCDLSSGVGVPALQHASPDLQSCCLMLKWNVMAALQHVSPDLQSWFYSWVCVDVGVCSAAGVACATGLHVASAIFPLFCPNWIPPIRHEEMWCHLSSGVWVAALQHAIPDLQSCCLMLKWNVMAALQHVSPDLQSWFPIGYVWM